jgi:hypothetical protein
MKTIEEKTKKQLNLHVISGSILIHNNTGQNQYMIGAKHPMFKNEYVKVNVSSDCLVFSVPTLDYKGKMYKTHINNKSIDWRYFSVTNELLITGKFEIDTEESTEDELVVYYR